MTDWPTPTLPEDKVVAKDELERQRWEEWNHLTRTAGGALLTDVATREDYPGTDEGWEFLLDQDAMIERITRRRSFPMVTEKEVPPDPGKRIPFEFVNVTLDIIEPRDEVDGQALCLDLMVKWKEKYTSVNSTRKGLRLLGPTGTGKSLMLSALAQTCRDDGAYWPIREFAAALFAKRDDGLNHFIESLVSRKLLILDDIGVGRDKDTWVYETIAGIIERRSTRNGVLHIGSNLADAGLGQLIGERAVSRLHEMTATVVLNGPDQRKA